MRAGLLTEIVKILQPVDVESEYSGNSLEYRDYITTRANITHVSSRREIYANEIANTSIIKVTIRNYHKVSPDMILVCNGLKYGIIDINPERSKQSITITADIINE